MQDYQTSGHNGDAYRPAPTEDQFTKTIETYTASGRDGKTVLNARRHQAVVLPAGCYYQFCNSGDSPLVMARIGAGSDKQDQRLNPDGTAIPGRTHEQGAAKPVLIEGAFFE